MKPPSVLQDLQLLVRNVFGRVAIWQRSRINPHLVGQWLRHGGTSAKDDARAAEPFKILTVSGRRLDRLPPVFSKRDNFRPYLHFLFLSSTAAPLRHCSPRFWVWTIKGYGATCAVPPPSGRRNGATLCAGAITLRATTVEWRKLSSSNLRHSCANPNTEWRKSSFSLERTIGFFWFPAFAMNALADFALFWRRVFGLD
jgi:hypothetical protein